MTSKTFNLMAAGAALSLVIAAPAFSQQTAPAAPAQGQQIDVSDEKMKDFVKVHQQVQAIHQNYQAEAQKAGTDQEKAAALVRQTNEQVANVIEASPVTVEEFNQIAMLLPQDQKLQQRYQKALGR